MSQWWLVLLGGFVGAPLRFLVGRVVSVRWKRAFPLGTFLINITGSILLGVLYAATKGSAAYAFFGTGVMGAYTTFSTFGTEAVALFESDRMGLMALYVVGSAVLGVLGAWVGMSMVY